MVGPVTKIDPDTLPKAVNIHWLGKKGYDELPGYMAGWQAAIMPFAKNDATRFISPTKTPEYLAAGCPVVSTSIRDVVSPYGDLGLAKIADTPVAFASAVTAAISEGNAALLPKADALLQQTSWDRTFGEMWKLVEETIAARARTSAQDTGWPRQVTSGAEASCV
jgi:UDP-galactopyranose mutase